MVVSWRRGSEGNEMFSFEISLWIWGGFESFLWLSSFSIFCTLASTKHTYFSLINQIFQAKLHWKKRCSLNSYSFVFHFIQPHPQLHYLSPTVWATLFNCMFWKIKILFGNRNQTIALIVGTFSMLWYQTFHLN